MEPMITSFGISLAAGIVVEVFKSYFPTNINTQIEKAFDVNTISLSVAGLEITGASTYATNNGFIANPNATKEEVEKLKKIFKVTGAIGSLNYGNPFVNGSILANSRGAIVGTQSTPFELGRVDDALFSK